MPDIIGYGTTLGYSTTSGGTYTTIMRIMDVPIPEVDIAKIDDTAMDSPSNTMEYIPGMKDPADVDLDVRYRKAQEATLRAQHGISQFWKITSTDGSTWVYPGFLRKIGGSLPVKDIVMSKITIAVTGAVTFTAGS